jgi:hypothetical protein
MAAAATDVHLLGSSGGRDAQSPSRRIDPDRRYAGRVTQKPRYRTEDGRSVIDIHVRTTDALFDKRDPAPFRERDVDDDAMDYLLGAVEELPRRAALALAIWVSEPCAEDVPDEEVVAALRAHFTWQRDRLAHRLREHLRRAQGVMLAGLVLLMLFLAIAALAETYLAAGPWTRALTEGLTIVGWVAIWRPVEALLYDWWPLAAERRVQVRLLEAAISVRRGTGPESHQPG